MKRNLPPWLSRPKNDNQLPSSARPARGPANDNAGPGAGEDGDDELEPSLAELSGVVRDSARELLELLEGLFSPTLTADTPARLDELLQADIAASVDQCIAEWEARLEAEAAAKMADLVVYNAAVILGRRIWGYSDDVVRSQGERSDRDCAIDLLRHLARFADLFGEPDTWNGQAAHEYALEVLARPLGMISGGDTGAVDLAIDVVEDVLTELTARSWRDIVGVFLDLPIQTPPSPNWASNWRTAVDRVRLGRALERAVARDGLVRIVTRPAVTGRSCLLSRDSIWLVTSERVGEGAGGGGPGGREPEEGTAKAPGRLVTRVDHLAVAEVQAALELPAATAIRDWQPQDFACPRPRCAIRLPERTRTHKSCPEEVAVVRQRSADGSETESLLVIGELPGGWGVWLIPTQVAERAARDSALDLQCDGDALPPSVRFYPFGIRPRLIPSPSGEPMVFVCGEPVRLFRFGPDDANSGSDPQTVEIDGIQADRIDRAYSVAPPPGGCESHVLITCGDEVRLYGGSADGEPWWQRPKLEVEAHEVLAPGVSVFDVVHDSVVLQRSEGLWAFVPLLALFGVEPACLAVEHAKARSLLSRLQHGAPENELAALSSWIRVGRLSDVSADDSGTIAVTFADSSWIELYERGEGLGPEHVYSVDRRYQSRGSTIAHLGSSDGEYLILEMRNDRFEFHRVSRGVWQQPAEHGSAGVGSDRAGT